jgi:diguanylate cyclase (GGDEF)-like protein/PAS domain S-box-containing protein
MASFLLLPGDGLLLFSTAGDLEWIDPQAAAQLGPLADDLRQRGLADAWPALAEQIETLEPLLEIGPQDIQLSPPPASGSELLNLRLFLSDTGTGVGLLHTRPADEPEHPLVLQLATVLNTIQDSLLITLAAPMDAPGPLIVYANDAVLHQTGYGLHQVLGRSPRLFQGPDTDQAVTGAFGKALRRWERPQMEVLNYSSAGRAFWIELKAAPLADANGAFTHWVAVQRDVSDRRAGEQALVAQALCDPLTGLLNRRGLTERLELALTQPNQTLALIFCDLDRFKEVNDRHGHSAGDALLLELTRRLQTVLRGADSLARLGGDEFVVLMEQLKEERDALQLAERLRRCLAKPWRHDGEEVWLSMSMGVATATSQRDVLADELLRRADLTMYRVKEAGRDGVALYDQDADREVQRVVGMRQQLEQGLRHHRFQLDYQPQVELLDGRIVGAEALVRLLNAQGERLSPATFIPLAERTGLIVPVECWVIGQALECLANWQRQGLPWSLSVNISPQHLERGDLVEQLLREQQRSGADLRGLTVEITETVMLQAQAEAHERLLQLKAAGVRIALDDFGTGYSSLAWLSRLPVDAVKLDQTYVQQMAEDERCALLVRGFVRVFQEMGLQVVAEGIETEEQRQRLLEMGCHLGQGYLFGRPAPLNAAPWDATVD